MPTGQAHSREDTKPIVGNTAFTASSQAWYMRVTLLLLHNSDAVPRLHAPQRARRIMRADHASSSSKSLRLMRTSLRRRKGSVKGSL